MKDISTHHLLHRLWTKAVGTPDYDKREWKELESRLIQGSRDPQPRPGGSTWPQTNDEWDAQLKALDGKIDDAMRKLLEALVKKARGG